MINPFVVRLLVPLALVFLRSLNKYDIVSALPNHVVSFDGCNNAGKQVFSVEGASVVSSLNQDRIRKDVDCLYLFQVPPQYESYLVKLKKISLQLDSHGNIGCLDNLTIVNTDLAGKPSEVIFDIPCSNMSLDRLPEVVYTGPYMAIQWQSSSVAIMPGRFQLSLTAVNKSSTLCDPNFQFLCSNNDCISSELRCDGVIHCMHGDDELQCPKSSIVATRAPLLLPTTRRVRLNLPTYNPPEEDDIYLWLPLIVVVIFTCVMVSVILLGRRYVETHGYQRAGQSDVLMDTTISTTSSGPFLTTTRRTNLGGVDAMSIAIVGGIFSFILIVCLIIACRGSDSDNADITTFLLAKNEVTSGSVVASSTQSQLSPNASVTSLTSLDSVSSVTSLAILGGMGLLVTLICLFVALRDKIVQRYPCFSCAIQDTDQNGDVSSNPAYTDVDGVPRTPPPSYTDLARQISYVSYISQHSDQLSIPPGYDEALDLPDSPSGRRRSFQRRSVGSIGSGRSRQRNRPRIFSRSTSAQESRTRRISSDSSLATPDTPVRRGRAASDSSSVFYDPPLSATVIHEHPQWEAEQENEEPSGSQQVEVTVEMNTMSSPSPGEEDCDSDSQLLHSLADSNAPLALTSTPIAREGPSTDETENEISPQSTSPTIETHNSDRGPVATFFL